jgi:hypothetical protein
MYLRVTSLPAMLCTIGQMSGRRINDEATDANAFYVVVRRLLLLTVRHNFQAS